MLRHRPAWREQQALAAHISREDRRSPAARALAPRRAHTLCTRHPLWTNREETLEFVEQLPMFRIKKKY